MVSQKKSLWGRFNERIKTAKRGGNKLDISFLLNEARNLSTPDDFVRWMEQLLTWIRLSGGETTTPQTSLKFLFTRIDQNPQWKDLCAEALQQLILQSSFLHLFADIGVHSNYGFFREAMGRLVKRFFSTYGNPKLMDIALYRIFNDEKDANWLEKLPQELQEKIISLLYENPTVEQKIKKHISQAAAEASSILCIRISAIAIQKEILDRAGEVNTLQISPLRLQKKIETFFALLFANESQILIDDQHQKILEEIKKSREFLENVHEHLEQYGVSVSLVFYLESAESILNRLESLMSLSKTLHSTNAEFNFWGFFIYLLQKSSEEQKISPLLKSNFHLLSRKIVERSGATGENYITENKSEYYSMFIAALGGGFITAFTALIKFFAPVDSPPFLIGLYIAANYTFSFILMHHLHFKLATTQPAMTAAALAARLKNPTISQLPHFIDIVARISRSQFAAVTGNILAVVPTAFFLNFLSNIFWEKSFLSQGYAFYTLKTFDPLHTLTILYAALTGVALWFSGLFASWMENAYIYYQTPQALESHPFLNNLFGKNGLKKFIEKISRNLSGWSFAFCLGSLLAFVPIVGSFFGLPLALHHVTLTTGAASFSFSTIGWQNLSGSLILLTLLGIFLIGILNFSTSFIMAFNIAVRANDIPRARVRIILRACFAEFLRKPMKFFLP